MLAARYDLGPLADDVDATVAELVAIGAVAKLWARDPSLFGDPASDCADRMGWLGTFHDSAAQWPALRAAADEIAGRADRVLLMGMGGSSLFPGVLADTFGSAPGSPVLHVVDTTHPDALVRTAEQCPPESTFFLAASKSGSTIETRSHLSWSWARSGDPTRFGVITDPGSALGVLARERGFAHVWENDPDIGGRYSALSLFGMVPAALSGVDGEALLDGADEAAEVLGPLDGDDELHPGLLLGAVIGCAGRAGRTLLTLRVEPGLSSFGPWLEQLVAESLGKQGRGVLPITGESDEVIAATPERRVVVDIGHVEPLEVDAPRVAIAVEEPTDLGAHVVWWEFATAIAGRVLGVNPFDQPDVEAAKAAAREVLGGGAPVEPDPTSVEAALGARRTGETIIIDAFVDPGGRAAARLATVREEVADALAAPVILDFGPRFLHSTGQLHKGGPDDAVHLQVVEPPLVDVEIPDEPFTFGTLLQAQAAGDLVALRRAGRRADRVDLDELTSWRPTT